MAHSRLVLPWTTQLCLALIRRGAYFNVVKATARFEPTLTGSISECDNLRTGARSELVASLDQVLVMIFSIKELCVSVIIVFNYKTADSMKVLAFSKLSF